MAHNKAKLAEKICIQCNKPFSWRKKWERNWNEVRFCSLKCKKENKWAR